MTKPDKDYSLGVPGVWPKPREGETFAATYTPMADDVTPKVELPELPEPSVESFDRTQAEYVVAGFTADQMRAYATQAVLAERERAAKICDERVTDCEDSHASDGDERWLVYAKHAKRLAAAIRKG